MISSGVDIVSLDRIEKAIEKHEEAFLQRVCSDGEIALYKAIGNPYRKVEFLSGRFAAKEAVAKALGTGLGTEGVAMTDLEILKKKSGAPEVVLSGKAKEVYEKQNARSISVSISHDAGMAVAFCCIEKEEEKK